MTIAYTAIGVYDKQKQITRLNFYNLSKICFFPHLMFIELSVFLNLHRRDLKLYTLPLPASMNFIELNLRLFSESLRTRLWELYRGSDRAKTESASN